MLSEGNPSSKLNPWKDAGQEPLQMQHFLVLFTSELDLIGYGAAPFQSGANGRKFITDTSTNL